MNVVVIIYNGSGTCAHLIFVMSKVE